MSDQRAESRLRSPGSATRACHSDLEFATARVEAMARHLALSESEVIWCLEQNDWFGAVVIIAKLADLEVAQASAVLERGSVHGQLVLMRAARLSWPVVEWILAERSRVHRSEMGLHKALYLSLPALGRARTPKSMEANSNVVQFAAARKRRAQLGLAGNGRQRPC